jgi:hypothetical protein
MRVKYARLYLAAPAAPSRMPYLGRAVAAPRPRNPLPTPYGPSYVPDVDSAVSPWSYETPKPLPRVLPAQVLGPTAGGAPQVLGPTAASAPPPSGRLLPLPPSGRLLPLPVEDRGVARPLSRRSNTRAGMSSAPGAARARASYDALESHGRFELTDTGELTGGSRAIALHLPRRSRGFVLDPRVGDVICANAARGTRAVGGWLDVQFVTRDKYFPPGRRITSCLVGVPDEQWRRLFA